jgi:SAM-dependent methyltransferase
MIVCKICGAATTFIRLLQGDQGARDYPVFFCPACRTSQTQTTGDENSQALYDNIYHAPERHPGYRRYLRYKESSQGKVELLAYLASQEPQYLALKQQVAQLPRNARILEIGCGLGYSVAALRQAGFTNAWGSDLSVQAIRAAQEQFGQFYLHTSSISGRTFDFIFALEVIEHVERPLQFVREQMDRLRPQGRLLLTTPRSLVAGTSPTPINAWVSDRPPIHLWSFSSETFGALQRQLPDANVREVDIPIARSLLQRKAVLATSGMPRTTGAQEEGRRSVQFIRRISDTLPFHEDLRLLAVAVKKALGKGRDYVVLPQRLDSTIAIEIRKH